VLNGNPSDEVHVAPSLRRHRRAFGRVPELYGSDRGFFSEQNLAIREHDWQGMARLLGKRKRTAAARGGALMVQEETFGAA
jgi:hypothetical protein